MTAALDLTPEERAAWVRARAEFHVELRRPEPDETQLSDDEIWHGIRHGIFDLATDVLVAANRRRCAARNGADL